MIPSVVNSHIAETRSAVTALVGAFYRAIACAQQHAWLDQAAIDSYFKDDAGQPRTDIDITEAQFVAGIGAVLAIRETVNAGTIGADLTRIKV